MSSRISILDGLRVIAIFMVMFGHYTNFSSNPVISKIADYGALGVSMFFIISGFVIALSLERSGSFKKFIKKRYIRLAPGMFICSTVTFLFFVFIYKGAEYGASRNIYNYIIANTFIDPLFFDMLINDFKFYYIDNSYWSLWVEVNFYFIISFLYFLSAKNVIRNYLILCIIGIPAYVLFASHIGHKVLVHFLSAETIKYLRLVARVGAFFHECLWFLIGLYLYRLYNDKKNYKYIGYMSITLLVLIIWQRNLIATFIILGIFSIYLTFVYKPQYLSFLKNKFICKLGVASYSIYLIHYHIGVVCIKQAYKYLGKEVLILPFIMIGLVCIFALLSYKYFETPVSKFLKKILLTKK